ncbi:MAG: hypothetical protein EPN37_18970 [Chitinophagaceae bacterium]|nr:MAG: hypothetical protein EPN37_18970 [Chitinophagaceae bacterium]
MMARGFSGTINPGTTFCIGALHEALAKYGTSEIFNTDQGSQFTSDAFTGILKRHGIQINMDSCRRCYDNIFVERLWRSVKYECVYINAFENGRELHAALSKYFDNSERPHSAPGHRGDSGSRCTAIWRALT